MKKTTQRIIFGTLLILTFALIFYFSSATGTSSHGMSRIIAEWLARIIRIAKENQEIFIGKAEPYIRKLAHFSIYAFAGMWEILLLNTFEIKDEMKILGGTLIGLLYAISDEIHQGFTPGRSPQVMDVIIDTEGNLFGILIVLLIIMVLINKRKKDRK